MGPIRGSWLIGVGGGEIPWLGTVKLMVSGQGTPGTSHVPSSSFFMLFSLIAAVLIFPMILDPAVKKFMRQSSEYDMAMVEQKKYMSEEE